MALCVTSPKYLFIIYFMKLTRSDEPLTIVNLCDTSMNLVLKIYFNDFHQVAGKEKINYMDTNEFKVNYTKALVKAIKVKRVYN